MAGEAMLTERRQRLNLHSWLVLGVGLGTLGFVGVVIGVVWLFERTTGTLRRNTSPPAAYAPPRLQSDPAGDLRDYVAAQRARLTGSGRVDQGGNPARIPIERAMALIVARGTAAYDPLDPPRQPDPRR